jgi:endonuclease/exonuclease/phosphatase family metal-dependent hydrolase
MKKVVQVAAVFLFVVLPLFSQAPTPKEGTIIIASWNIRDFSSKSRDDVELTQICGILAQLDIVGIQEVLDTEVLDRTVAMLKQKHGLDFAYVASAKEGSSAATAERFCYLFRSDKVAVLGTPTVVTPQAAVVTREPFYALFKAGSFDFYLAEVHLLSCKKDAEGEAVQVARAYEAVQGLDAEDDVILMGDFNLPPTDAAFADLKGIPSMTWVDASEPTTIYDHFYDNLWFESNFTTEYSCEWGIYKFDEELFANDDRAASLAVSDHRPVWARFSTK